MRKHSPRVDYYKYIRSPRWRARREKFLKSVGRKCQGCGSSGIIQVHHRSYRNLGRERNADLRAVCKSCHMKIHFLEKSCGLSLVRATDKIVVKAPAPRVRRFPSR